MLFKQEEFENAGFAFKVDIKQFETELFENDEITIMM